MSTNTKVLIIGSGRGGLSLAQSLRRSNIPFEIYERDSTPFGNPHPRSPGSVQRDITMDRTAHEPMTPGNLRVIRRLLTRDNLGEGMWPKVEEESPVHANVDRATLRQILLSGLDDSIHFEKKFERYEIVAEDNGIAHFADGTSATGSCLVGADVVSSHVRVQRAPNLARMDADITAIYGRLPVKTVQELGHKEALEDIFLIASDERKVFLGLESVIFPTPPHEALDNELHLCESYVVCIVGGRHGIFPECIRKATSAELQTIAASLIEGWSGNAAPLVRTGDSESFFAVHSMTPSLGRGANLAMRHGALLERRLKLVAGGQGNLADELAAYEESMVDYGFNVVREAAEIGRQRMGQSPLEDVVDA